MEEVIHNGPCTCSCMDFKPYFLRPDFCINCFHRIQEHDEGSVKCKANFGKVTNFLQKEDYASIIVEESDGLGNIYLSGFMAPLVDTYLKKINVKSILNVAGKSIKQIFRPCYVGIAANIRQELCIVHMELQWEDNFTYKLTNDTLEEAVQFIEKGRQKGSVLVHCVQGKSRSAAAVCAYLMAKENIGMLDAIEKIQACRPMVDPNANYRLTLKKYETSDSLQLLRMKLAEHSSNDED